MKAFKKIPEFNTEDEEFEFWSKVENIFDYLDPAKFKEVPPPMVPKTHGLHSVILSPELEDEVQRLSHERKIGVQEMITQLVVAGLKQQQPPPQARA